MKCLIGFVVGFIVTTGSVAYDGGRSVAMDCVGASR